MGLEVRPKGAFGHVLSMSLEMPDKAQSTPVDLGVRAAWRNCCLHYCGDAWLAMSLAATASGIVWLVWLRMS